MKYESRAYMYHREDSKFMRCEGDKFFLWNTEIVSLTNSVQFIIVPFGSFKIEIWDNNSIYDILKSYRWSYSGQFIIIPLENIKTEI